MIDNYIANAFQQLDSLNEDMFELSDEGIEKLKAFEDEPVEDEVIVTDLEAEDEASLEDSYVGKVIIDCDVCHSLLYKDRDEVIIDEETEMANVGEECPFCTSTSGYKIIGQVAEFKKDEEHKDDEEHGEEEVKDEEKISVETDKFQEGLKRARARKAGIKRVTESKSRRIKEEWDDTEVSVSEYILSKINGKKVVTWDEFNDAFDKACRRYKCTKHGDDFETNVRTLLSLKGYGTEYEGDNEGGLKLAESKSRRIKEDKTTARDRIDARRDNRVERAKKSYAKTLDDADAQRDDRLKKDGLKEAERMPSRRPVPKSIEDAQKWVDYDMKRYGKISDKTNAFIRKAGYQIIKDQYGDYEVAAGKFESKEMNEAPVYGLRPEYDSRKSFGGKANVEIDGYGTETLYSYDTPVARYTKEGTVELLPKWDLSQTTLRHVKEFLRQHGLKADSLAQIKKDYLKENFERVDIETDREKMSMTAEEGGKVVVTTEPKTEEKKEDKEVIVPVDDETKVEIEDESEKAAEEDSIDLDIEDFEEETFDELGESYLKKVYDNVKSYKTTNAVAQKSGMKLEGLITFNSGKTKKTSFVFEAKEADKNNKVKFIGENLEITRGKKAFTLVGNVKDKKLVSESLNYNYRAKDGNGKSQRVYGTIKK